MIGFYEELKLRQAGLVARQVRQSQQSGYM